MTTIYWEPASAKEKALAHRGDNTREALSAGLRMDGFRTVHVPSSQPQKRHSTQQFAADTPFQTGVCRISPRSRLILRQTNSAPLAWWGGSGEWGHRLEKDANCLSIHGTKGHSAESEIKNAITTISSCHGVIVKVHHTCGLWTRLT